MQPQTLFTQAVEFAGFGLSGRGIRHTRPQILFYRQRVQPFSTKPRFHDVQSSISTDQQRHVDEQFIPWVTEDALVERAASSKASQNRRWNDKRLDVNDEWEAQVEITAPTASIGTLAGSAIAGDHRNAGRTQSSIPEHTVDPSGQTEDLGARTVITADPAGVQQPVIGRVASRLARKERRLRDGTYPRMAREADHSSATGKGPEQGHDAVTDSALEKVEEKEGLPLPTKQPEKIPGTSETTEDFTARAAFKSGADSGSQPAATTTQFKKPKREPWQVRKAALDAKFGSEGWQPRKRLSPDTLDGIRALHKSDPTSYSTATLSEHFRITPDAIRRILKSKWRPSEEEVEDRRQRWEKRGRKKWEDMAGKGVKPPVKWRAMGVKSPAARARETERGGKDQYVKWDDR